MTHSKRGRALWPHFFIIGASKCGTTSLHHYLDQNPDIFMPSVKEPGFFTSDDFQNDLDWYFKLYNKAGEAQKRGEATPGYLYHSDIVIPRLSALPRIPQFVVAFRHPVDRMWSHYLHNRRRGVENLPLEDALIQEARRVDKRPGGWFGYRRESEYAQALQPWLSAFGKHNFFFVINEELESQPSSVLSQLFAFLGADPAATIATDRRHNAAGEVRFNPINRFLGNPPRIVQQVVTRLVPTYYRRYLREKIMFWNQRPFAEKPKMTDEMYG